MKFIFRFEILTIKLIRVLTGINDTFLAITLIAVGNSTGDLFALYSLAKKGYSILAMTGIYSSQLFNLLVGFGSSLLR